jgi:hypothetical protein
MSIKQGIHETDGSHGRSECQAIEGHCSKRMGRKCQQRPPRGNAVGTQPFEEHRHARSAPGKVGSPTEITANADHRQEPKGKRMRIGPVQPGRPVSDASSVLGGTPMLGGGEKKRGRIKRFVLAFFFLR